MLLHGWRFYFAPDHKTNGGGKAVRVPGVSPKAPSLSAEELSGDEGDDDPAPIARTTDRDEPAPRPTRLADRNGTALAPEVDDEPPAPSKSGVAAFLEARGVDPSAFENDEDALGFLYEQASRAAQYADFGEQAAPEWDEYQQWKKSRSGHGVDQADPSGRQQAGAAGAGVVGGGVPATTKPKRTAPEFDPDWEQRATWNAEAGQFIPNTAADAHAAAGLNKFLRWQREEQRKFLADPNAYIRAAGLEDELTSRDTKLQEYVQQQVREQLVAFSQQQQIEQRAAEQRAKLYVLNDQGQPLVNPRTGQPKLSPYGEAAVQYGRLAQQYGIADPGKAQQFILDRLASDEAAGKFGEMGTKAGGKKQPASKRPTVAEPFLRSPNSGGGHGKRVPQPEEPDDTDIVSTSARGKQAMRSIVADELAKAGY